MIEAEPSIYDDYSMYDSQYGYASKVYNSESEYDSQYGVVEEEYGSHSQGRERGRQGEQGGTRYLHE